MNGKKMLFILPMVISLVACGNGGGAAPIAKESIFHGKGAPSNSLGSDFSHYYDEDSHYVYEKNGGKWINQLTFGSPSLYAEANQKRDRAVNSDDHQKLKDALMTSFYSTNTTFTMAPKNMPEGNNYLYEVNKRDIKMTLSSTDYEESFYFRVDDEGTVYVYVEGQGYVKEAMGEQTYVAVPHPTLENITFTNFLLYDDELGQQTSIVCGNLDKVTYDEESKEYTISDIHISYTNITTRHYKEPQTGELTFSFVFTLSEDGTYVDYAMVDFGEGGQTSFEYTFTKMHTTSFVMPE